MYRSAGLAVPQFYLVAFSHGQRLMGLFNGSD
jgi:hypothetical protein